MAEKFPNLGKDTGIQVQEAQRTPLKINKNKSTTRHTIVRLAKYKDEERILKAARDKWSLIYKGRHIKLAVDLSTEICLARREWHDIFNVLNRTNRQQRILYPAGLSFRIDREINFLRQGKTKQVHER